MFQENGPYYDTIHGLLAAYACYRPDIGYVSEVLQLLLLIHRVGPGHVFLSRCTSSQYGGKCIPVVVTERRDRTRMRSSACVICLISPASARL